MTTRRAIGSYAIDATDAEKIDALYQTVEDAIAELADLGEPYDEVENRTLNALDSQEYEQ